MKNIAINEPCHENWAEFTPTEKGAFCSKCAVDVIDFSTKSNDEIKEIIKSNLGESLCGRFKKSQLDNLNHDYTLWENQSSRTFQSKFIYALVMVFGFTLFSCSTEGAMILGEINTNNTENTALNIHNNQNVNTYYTSDFEHEKGKVKYTEDDSTSCSNNKEIYVKGDTILWEDEMVDGEMEYSQAYMEYLTDTTIVETEVTEIIQEEIFTLGEIIVEIEDPISLESTKEPISETGSDVYIPSTHIFSAECFPNPTNNQSNIFIDVKESNVFDIYLYEINGKRIKSIYQGELSEGRQQFTIDLSNYASGIYLIVINGGVQKETIKINKAL